MSLSYRVLSGFFGAALAVALTIGVGAREAAAQEERCTELGSSCQCSEPLNSPTLGFDGNFRFNPDDSTPSTKECPGELQKGSPLVGYDAGSFTQVSPTGLPAGAQVSYVTNNHRARFIYGPGAPAGTKRLCTRAYVRYSSDWQSKDLGDSDCQAEKIAQFGWNPGETGGGSQFHWNAHSPTSWPLAVKNGWTGCGGTCMIYNTDPSGWNPTMCRGAWCRIEMCAGTASGGDVRTGNNLYAEAYVDVVTGPNAGKRAVYPRTFVGTAWNGAGGNLGWTWLLNLYRQGTCPGDRQISHAMQAAWTADQGQLIGPAYEIEGGDSGGSGDPPASPPEAPVLLP
jgi:hypothetical protein